MEVAPLLRHIPCGMGSAPPYVGAVVLEFVTAKRATRPSGEGGYTARCRYCKILGRECPVVVLRDRALCV